MDIRREVEISRYQHPAFIAGTEMGELYLAMKNRWGGKKSHFVVRSMQACFIAWVFGMGFRKSGKETNGDGRRALEGRQWNDDKEIHSLSQRSDQ